MPISYAGYNPAVSIGKTYDKEANGLERAKLSW